MEAKLKALKVADLKDILSKSGTTIGSKATKADLIAKILATPAALTLAGGEAPAPAAPAPVPAPAADDDLLAPPDEFDWEAESGEKKDEVKAAEAPAPATETPAPAATTSAPAPATTEAASTTEPAASTTEPAATTETEKPAEDDDVARRKARAARFGIPFVENPTPTGRKREKAKKEDKPKEDKAEKKDKAEKDKPVEKKDGVEKKDKAEKKDKPMRISAKEAAPNDDDAKLAARAARFGISTSSSTAKASADADPAEEEKRKKREARFGAPAAKKPKTDT